MFVKLTALTAAKKWQPGFDEKLNQIIKRCKLCTHHSDIIDTEVDQFNDVIQVEIIDGVEENSGHMPSFFAGKKKKRGNKDNGKPKDDTDRQTKLVEVTLDYFLNI